MGKWLIRNTEEPEENQSRGTDRTSTAMNVSHAKRERNLQDNMVAQTGEADLWDMS